MSLQNRISEHINRKKLTIVEKEVDLQGNIVSITVDVTRAEGNVLNQGTILNAESLKSEILTLINENSNVLKNSITQCVCDNSNNVATTKFVWDVLKALGYTQINHNLNDYSDQGSAT